MTVLKNLHPGHPVGLTAFLIVPLSLFAPKAVAPLFALAVVFGLLIATVRHQPLRWPSRAIIFGFLALIFWAGLTLFWADAPYVGLRLLPMLAVTFFSGLALVGLVYGLPKEQRQSLDRALVWGFALGLAILAVESLTPLFFTQIFRELVTGNAIRVDSTAANYYKAGTTVAAVMVWPALAALVRMRMCITAFVLAVFTAAVLWNSGSGSSVLAFVGGMTTVIVVRFFNRTGTFLVAAALTVGIVAMPLLPPLLPDAGSLEQSNPNLSPSIFPRIYIWQSAVKYIETSPILGLGLNSSRTLTSSKDSVIYTRPEETGVSRMSEPIPGHPHNFALQLWIELGFPGVAIVAGLFILIIMRVRARVPTPETALVYGTLVSAATINFVTYSVWSSWWQGTLWLAAAFLAAEPAEDRLSA